MLTPKGSKYPMDLRPFTYTKSKKNVCTTISILNRELVMIEKWWLVLRQSVFHHGNIYFLPTATTHELL